MAMGTAVHELPTPIYTVYVRREGALMVFEMVGKNVG